MQAYPLLRSLTVGNHHTTGATNRVLGDSKQPRFKLGGNVGFVFRHDDRNKLNGHGGRIPLQGLQESLIIG